MVCAPCDFTRPFSHRRQYEVINFRSLPFYPSVYLQSERISKNARRAKDFLFLSTTLAPKRHGNLVVSLVLSIDPNRLLRSRKSLHCNHRGPSHMRYGIYRALSLVLLFLEAVVGDLERVVGHGSPLVKTDNLATKGQQRATPTRANFDD